LGVIVWETAFMLFNKPSQGLIDLFSKKLTRGTSDLFFAVTNNQLARPPSPSSVDILSL
jgi:hypothetical protein